jgi:hypothetical protein
VPLLRGWVKVQPRVVPVLHGYVLVCRCWAKRGWRRRLTPSPPTPMGRRLHAVTLRRRPPARGCGPAPPAADQARPRRRRPGRGRLRPGAGRCLALLHRIVQRWAGCFDGSRWRAKWMRRICRVPLGLLDSLARFCRQPQHLVKTLICRVFCCACGSVRGPAAACCTGFYPAPAPTGFFSPAADTPQARLRMYLIGGHGCRHGSRVFGICRRTRPALRAAAAPGVPVRPASSASRRRGIPFPAGWGLDVGMLELRQTFWQTLLRAADPGPPGPAGLPHP